MNEFMGPPTPAVLQAESRLYSDRQQLRTYQERIAQYQKWVEEAEAEGNEEHAKWHRSEVRQTEEWAEPILKRIAENEALIEGVDLELERYRYAVDCRAARHEQFERDEQNFLLSFMDAVDKAMETSTDRAREIAAVMPDGDDKRFVLSRIENGPSARWQKLLDERPKAWWQQAREERQNA